MSILLGAATRTIALLLCLRDGVRVVCEAGMDCSSPCLRDEATLDPLEAVSDLVVASI